MMEHEIQPIEPEPSSHLQNSSNRTVAYLINQYPKVSHSFIRREIIALEATGIKVLRFSVRQVREELVDPADADEAKKTTIVLGAGIPGLCIAMLREILLGPILWLRALSLTLRLGLRSDRGLLRHLAYLAEACVLKEMLCRSQVKHLHAHFGTNPTAIAMLCHKLGGPGYSFTVHGAAEFDRLTTLGIGMKIERARFIVAVSLYGRSQLYRYCSQKYWPRIQLVHCGVDHSFLQHDPTPVPHHPRLVCIGRLSSEKGQLLLIEAVGRLKMDGLEFELTLVGDGEQRVSLEALIQRYDLQDKVRIIGWASAKRVRQEILAARALILPSFMEGIPVVIMEAFAMARPVVSTRVAGIPELVQDGENGWLIHPGSTKALMAAIRQVLAAPIEQLNAMGQAGRIQIQAHHHTPTEVEKLAALFRGYIDVDPKKKQINMVGTQTACRARSDSP